VLSVVSALVAVGLVLFLWLGQRRLLYLPVARVLPPDAVGLRAVRPLTISTADGIHLGAWYVPPAGDAPPAATVIVFNGNAGNRSYRAPLAGRLADAGYATVLFDYRGYGGNPGSPTESGLLEDARALLRSVSRMEAVDSGRVVYLGESLGSGVAVRLALESPPAGLVLRSPFTSVTDVAAHHYWFLPVRRLLWDRFDSLARIGDLRCPLLVVAGDGDSVVPIAFSRRLFDAAPEPKAFVTVAGANHNDEPLAAGTPLMEAMLPRLRAWAAAPR